MKTKLIIIIMIAAAIIVFRPKIKSWMDIDTREREYLDENTFISFVFFLVLHIM